ncbi:MAG: hypothetical protein WC369_05755 [Dehalococcoidales bacterium]
MKDWFSRLVGITTVSLLVMVALQELEKPEEKRQWYGKVARFVPYDFRWPNREAVLSAFWNPYDGRVLVPTVCGIGWAVNFWALLDDMGILRPDITEEHFLMPTDSIKEKLASQADGEETSPHSPSP